MKKSTQFIMSVLTAQAQVLQSWKPQLALSGIENELSLKVNAPHFDGIVHIIYSPQYDLFCIHFAINKGPEIKELKHIHAIALDQVVPQINNVLMHEGIPGYTPGNINMQKLVKHFAIYKDLEFRLKYNLN